MLLIPSISELACLPLQRFILCTFLSLIVAEVTQLWRSLQMARCVRKELLCLSSFLDFQEVKVVAVLLSHRTRISAVDLVCR